MSRIIPPFRRTTSRVAPEQLYFHSTYYVTLLQKHAECSGEILPARQQAVVLNRWIVNMLTNTDGYL